MRKRKKLKKRKEPVNYEGRRYKDYLESVSYTHLNVSIFTIKSDKYFCQQLEIYY